MSGEEAGGGDGGEGLLVPEPDLELLGHSLGEDGVPGDGGGDECEGGNQTSEGVLSLNISSSSLQTTQSSQSISYPSEASILHSLGGEDVVGAGGDSLGLHDGGQDLSCSECHLEHAGLNDRLGGDDWRALSDNLMMNSC